MSDGSAESQLRKSIGKARGTGRVPEWAWQRLKLRGHIESTVRDLACLPEGDSRIAREVIRLADYVDCWIDDRQGDVQGEHLRISPPMVAAPESAKLGNFPYTDDEHKRIQANAAYLAVMAAQESKVIAFREQFLGPHVYPSNEDPEHFNKVDALAELRCDGGHFLTARQALHFLNSPVLAWFQAGTLADWGVPFLAHKWRMLPERRDHYGLAETDHIFIAYSNRQHRIEPIPNPDGRLGTGGLALLHCKRGQRWSEKQPPSMPHTPLQHLRDVAQYLHDVYDWQPHAAMWWVLTGTRYPVVQPVKRSMHSSVLKRTYTVEAEEWIAPERVAQAYSSLRQRPGPSPRRSRSRDARTMDLCIFVLQRAGALGEGAEWPVLFQQWNDTHPTSRFGRIAALRQQFYRGLATLQNAPYDPRRFHEDAKSSQDG